MKAVKINFDVNGLTRLGIEPASRAPEADVITARPSELFIIIYQRATTNLPGSISCNRIFIFSNSFLQLFDFGIIFHQFHFYLTRSRFRFFFLNSK